MWQAKKDYKKYLTDHLWGMKKISDLFLFKRNLMLKFIQILIIFYRYKHKPTQSGTIYDEVNSVSVITAVMINFSLGTQIGISECIFKQTIQFL